MDRDRSSGTADLAAAVRHLKGPITVSKSADPCPFCGDDEIWQSQNDGVYLVTCWRCSATMISYEGMSEAIADWNRRTPPQVHQSASACETSSIAFAGPARAVFRRIGKTPKTASKPTRKVGGRGGGKSAFFGAE